MVQVVFPNPDDLPKSDWKKMAEKSAKRARKINKNTEEAHKKAAKSKLRFEVIHGN